MPDKQERNCQIRMSASLWNQVSEIAQALGHTDPRGGHSAVIREIVAGATAMWRHSPYVRKFAYYTIYITGEGDSFLRQVEVLRLNTPREKLPCSVEMKPEKRAYYHRKYQERQKKLRDDLEKVGSAGNSATEIDEFKWFLGQWMINHFAVWNGKKDPDDLEAFQQQPLDAQIDTFGTTYKSADLVVREVGGRFLTREITAGLCDYVQWREPGTPIFDRIDIPIDIPTSLLEVSVIVDQELFAALGVEADEISNLALEFRNRETARFEGKEAVSHLPRDIEEICGRSAGDEGADDMLRKVRRLRQRVIAILDNTPYLKKKSENSAGDAYMLRALTLPQNFLFYRLRWPSPLLGIEACVRWEKPLKKTE